MHTCQTSARMLKILSAVVWYTGAIFLLIKSIALLSKAHSIQASMTGLWLAIIVGIILGSLKARLLFRHLCQKNLERIAGLKHPKVWQFFRLRFFFSLFLMILLGVVLSRWAEQHYGWLLWVAGLDLSIAVALLGSSLSFYDPKMRSK